MNSIIVEKTVVEPDGNTTYYAVATSQRHRHSVRMSLAYEAHLTPWGRDRAEVEALQTEIEAEGTP